MIKIYRIREDGSYKDFYCKFQEEADEKLKLPNFTDKLTKLKKEKVTDEKLLSVITQDDEIKIKEITDKGYSKEHAIKVIKG